MGKLTQIAGLQTQREKQTALNLQTIAFYADDLDAQLNLQKFFAEDGYRDYSKEQDTIQKNLIRLNAESWARSPSHYELQKQRSEEETLVKAVRIAREVLNK